VSQIYGVVASYLLLVRLSVCLHELVLWG